MNLELSEALTQMLENIVKPLRPDWERGLKAFLGRAKGKDFSNKGFDGELVDVIYEQIKERPKALWFSTDISLVKGTNHLCVSKSNRQLSV